MPVGHLVIILVIIQNQMNADKKPIRLRAMQHSQGVSAAAGYAFLTRLARALRVARSLGLFCCGYFGHRAALFETRRERLTRSGNQVSKRKFDRLIREEIFDSQRLFRQRHLASSGVRQRGFEKAD